MNNICTSIEQSQKLIELGIDVSTADMFWWHNTEEKRYEASLNDYAFICDWDIPAWSLSALLSVLPSVIKRNGKRMFLTMEKAGAYNIYYKSPDRRDELWETKEEPIDAAFGMICLLKEFGKI